jgi:four helix bundle protein
MKKSRKQQDIQKKGYSLAKSVFEVTNSFESEEMKGLVSQMRNAAIAIPSNIANSTTQKTKKKATPYLIVARGFLNKLDNHIEHSRALGMINTRYYKNIEIQIQSINSLLTGLLRK